MPPFINSSGLKFGRLTVLRRAENAKSGDAQFFCRCDCGKDSISTGWNLKTGNTRSCGCYQEESRIKHGLWQSHTYNCWSNMKARCQNENHDSYKHYGGRGITVCERWQEYKKFFTDMGDSPTESHPIDRINNNGNYDPGNCRWATRKQQQNNRRNSHMLEFQGQRKTMAQWAECLGIRYQVIFTRIDRNWPVDRALTTPVRGRK